jgi:hypothetical protein
MSTRSMPRKPLRALSSQQLVHVTGGALGDQDRGMVPGDVIGQAVISSNAPPPKKG